MSSLVYDFCLLVDKPSVSPTKRLQASLFEGSIGEHRFEDFNHVGFLIVLPCAYTGL
jgi:hypothetical protein